RARGGRLRPSHRRVHPNISDEHCRRRLLPAHEVRRMTGRDFLAVAIRLAAGAEEGDWRSAVSRAYYAAFHMARSHLTDLGFSVPREERAHKYLSYRLMNAPVGNAVRAGTDLD